MDLIKYKPLIVEESLSKAFARVRKKEDNMWAPRKLAIDRKAHVRQKIYKVDSRNIDHN